MKKSKMMSVSKKDATKGIIMMALTALIMGLYNTLQTGAFPVTWEVWQPILTSSISASLAYVIKNFFTSSEDKFLGKEPTA